MRREKLHSAEPKHFPILAGSPATLRGTGGTAAGYRVGVTSREPRRPLGRADEAHLLLDRGSNVYVITVAGLLGPGGCVEPGGAIDLDRLRRTVASRVATAPRLSGRLERRQDRTELVPCVIDLESHVRIVEAVAGLDGFLGLCSGLATVRLPMDRPLWELLIVPGAQPDGVGIVLRVHHAIADGVMAAQLLRRLFDPGDEGSMLPHPVVRPTRSTESSLSRGGSRAPHLVLDLVRWLPRTRMLGPLGPDRRLDVTTFELADVSAGSRSSGGTVNDALLAALTAGVRDAYGVLGEAVPAQFPVSVPVLLPGHDDETNQVSAMIVRLPLSTLDVRGTIALIASRTAHAAESVRSRPLPWFFRTRIGASMMRSYIARQRSVGVVSTNVRGPAETWVLAGAPLQSVWALPILGGNVRTAVAALSYRGRLSVCVLWDAQLGAAGDRLALRIGETLAEIAAAGRANPASAERAPGS